MTQINNIGGYSVVKGDLKFDYIMDGNHLVGKFKWQFKDEFVEVVEIFIEENYRRQGIASQVYATLQDQTGRDLKWIRNGFASNSMRSLAKKYAMENSVVFDDGNIFVVRRVNPH
jgi:GNAT superfamily N-acetyltransferase